MSAGICDIAIKPLSERSRAAELRVINKGSQSDKAQTLSLELTKQLQELTDNIVIGTSDQEVLNTAERVVNHKSYY